MSTFTLRGDGGAQLKLTSREDIEPHLGPLLASTDFVEVHFGGNTLGVGACERLAEVIKTQKNLQIVDLADIFTSRLISEIPPALQALCDALLDCPRLVEVDLSDNAFGGRSVEPMVPLLSRHPHLQVLKLSNNGLGPAGGTVIASAVLASAQSARSQGREPNLRRIVCGRNRLEDGSAETWAKALAAHGDSLLEFRAYQNGIRMDGVANLAKGLRSCRRLEHLDLQDNTAAERGSRAIAASLASWPDLVELNLSDCLLRPKGALFIASALNKGSNVKLARLRLQSDEVDQRAVNELAAAVEAGHLSALELIELNGNRCEAEDPAMERLVAALAKHGHEDALDEIDDVEEVDPHEEEAEEEELESEEEDAQAKDSARVIVPSGSGPGEDVTAADAPLVRAAAQAESAEPRDRAQSGDVDDLASAFGKTSI